MLVDAYIGKSVESMQYDIRKNNPGRIEFFYADQLDFSMFASLHQRSLLPLDRVRCFFNVDSLDKDKVFDLIPYIDQKVIWCFKTLPKSRKIYKKLSKSVEVKTVLDLSKTADKRKFITSLIKEYKVDKASASILMRLSGDDKRSIDNEIFKFSVASQVLPKAEASRVLSSYDANYDLLNFMNCLFGKPYEAYLYAEKVARSSSQFGLAAMLSKRIKYYIYLSLNDEEQARKYWNSSGYYLNQNKQEALNIGFLKLLKIHKLIDQTLTDFYDIRELNRKLNYIVYRCERILQE
jgi:hypothetical protein